MRELTAARATFGFETTLAGRSYVRQFVEWRRLGYHIVVFFLWLPDVELAIARVAQRVRRGGHDVSSNDVRRRFSAGLSNFWNDYRKLADRWRLYVAERNPPQLIAQQTQDEIQIVRTFEYASFVRDVRA